MRARFQYKDGTVKFGNVPHEMPRVWCVAEIPPIAYSQYFDQAEVPDLDIGKTYFRWEGVSLGVALYRDDEVPERGVWREASMQVLPMTGGRWPASEREFLRRPWGFGLGVNLLRRSRCLPCRTCGILSEWRP